MALKVGRLLAAVVLIYFRVRLSNEKIRQSASLPTLESSEELTDLLAKRAVVPTFILFGLEFGEHLYLPAFQAIGNKKDLRVKHYQIKIKKSKAYIERHVQKIVHVLA
jgi:hypothetical protein